MKNKILLFLVLFPFSGIMTIYAQLIPSNDSLAVFKTRPKFAVKYNPTALLDLLTPAHQFAVEYKIVNNISGQTEIGYINHNLTPIRKENNHSFSGFKIRNEVRLYYKSNKFNNNFYLAPEILIKQFDQTRTRYVLRFGGMYQQKMNVSTTSKAFAVHLKIGGQSMLFQNSNFIFDYYAGAGIRYLHKTNDLPEDAELENAWSLENDVFPSIVIGVKIGYAISY